jgi:hypothetical protein
LTDCIDIPEVYVWAPDGNITQLTPVETSVDGEEAYKVSFTVDKRGDYIVYATMNVSAIKGEFVDHAKALQDGESLTNATVYVVKYRLSDEAVCSG